MQKVRRQPFIPCGMHRPSTALWVYDFRFYFTPLAGVLFNFPSRYLYAFGQIRVFRLSPWSGQIHTGLPVPRTTWDASRVLENFVYRSITFFGAPSQTLLLFSYNPTLRSRNPVQQAERFSLFPLRSPLLRESHAFSSPVATKMFQFTTLASATYSFSGR